MAAITSKTGIVNDLLVGLVALGKVSMLTNSKPVLSADLCTPTHSLSLRCSNRLEGPRVDQEMKRRRMKASISSPSPLPGPQDEDEIEMTHGGRSTRTGDSASSTGGEGIDAGLHKYGLAGTTFLGE